MNEYCTANRKVIMGIPAVQAALKAFGLARRLT